MLCLLVHKHAPETPLGYGYIRAPSAVLQTASICKLKASVMHDRVGLGLNSRHINASPCPSPLDHGRPSGELITEKEPRCPTCPP